MFTAYLKEAVEPFVLVAGPRRIVIGHPSSASVAALDRAAGPLGVLRALLDDDTFAAVRGLLVGTPPGATAALALDVRKHYALACDPAGGWSSLVDLLDRYGAAIEFDLFSHGGWDILDWFRGTRPWPQLLRLVDKFPPLSQFRRAIADDDDLARQYEVSGAALTGPGKPTLAHWTELDDLKATIIDGFSLVQLAIASQHTPKGKPAPKFRATPRPKTAWHRAQRRRDEAAHRDIVSQVLPSQPPV